LINIAFAYVRSRFLELIMFLSTHATRRAGLFNFDLRGCVGGTLVQGASGEWLRGYEAWRVYLIKYLLTCVRGFPGAVNN